MAEVFLVVFPSNEFSCFLNTEVVCLWIAMVSANKFSLSDFKNVGYTLMMQDSIAIFLVFA